MPFCTGDLGVANRLDIRVSAGSWQATHGGTIRGRRPCAGRASTYMSMSIISIIKRSFMS